MSFSPSTSQMLHSPSFCTTVPSLGRFLLGARAGGKCTALRPLGCTYILCPGTWHCRSHTRTCSHHITSSFEYLKQHGHTYSRSRRGGMSRSRRDADAPPPSSLLAPFMLPT